MSREITTIGGGTGAPVVNEAALRTGKVDNIHAIAAVYDSGGATGRRRLDSQGSEVAYSDAMRISLSLTPPEERDTQRFKALFGLLNHRDETDKVLGTDVFNRLFDPVNGFTPIQSYLTDLTGIGFMGQVLPSSTEPSHIAFTTKSGRRFKGEHQLDDQRMSKDMVVGMELTPAVKAFPCAVEALKNDDPILLASGSLHGSVLSNFLPEGMKEAMMGTNAELWVVTNLVSTRNETHKFTPRKYAELVERYTGRRPNGLIVPELTREGFEKENPLSAKLYDAEHSHFLGWEDKELKDIEKDGIQVIKHDATKVLYTADNSAVVRHDPTKLAVDIAEIF